MVARHCCSNMRIGAFSLCTKESLRDVWGDATRPAGWPHEEHRLRAKVSLAIFGEPRESAEAGNHKS